MSKVLVIGGAGYIGGALVNLLKEKGVSFAVYDNLLYEENYLKPVPFIRGDVRDYKKLSKVLPNYPCVIWLAAIVGDAACQIKPELTIDVNLKPIEWLAKNYSGRIIFTSTCSVYGFNKNLIDETAPTNPLSLYAKTKLQAEKALKGKNALIFRLGTAFGISDAFSRLRFDLAVNYMTAKAVTEGKLTVYGGEQWRPFAHIKDIAKAIFKGLNLDVKGIFNIATFNYQIKEVAQVISKVTNCQIEYTEQKFEDDRDYHIKTEKAERFGIFPIDNPITIEQGSRELKQCILEGRIKYIEHHRYFNEYHLLNLLKNGKI